MAVNLFEYIQKKRKMLHRNIDFTCLLGLLQQILLLVHIQRGLLTQEQ